MVLHIAEAIRPRYQSNGRCLAGGAPFHFLGTAGTQLNTACLFQEPRHPPWSRLLALLQSAAHLLHLMPLLLLRTTVQVRPQQRPRTLVVSGVQGAQSQARGGKRDWAEGCGRTQMHAASFAVFVLACLCAALTLPGIMRRYDLAVSKKTAWPVLSNGSRKNKNEYLPKTLVVPNASGFPHPPSHQASPLPAGLTSSTDHDGCRS